MRPFRPLGEHQLVRLAAFFWEPHLFTASGLAELALRYFGILALGISLTLFAQRPSVTVENVTPFACFDLNQFLEMYDEQKTEAPESVVAALRNLTAIGLPNVFHANLARPRSFTMDLSGPHLRYVPDETTRIVYCSFLDGAPIATGPPQRAPGTGSARERLMAVVSPQEGFDTTLAIETATRLIDLDSNSEALRLEALIHRTSQTSRYRAEAWDGSFILVEAGIDAIVQAVEEATSNEQERETVFSRILGSRWIVNPLRIRNPERAVVSGRVRIEVTHSAGTIQHLGGSMPVKILGKTILGLDEDLLPDETRWIVIRTNVGKISDEEIRVLADPAPVIDPQIALLAFATACGITALQLFINILFRSHARLRRRLELYRRELTTK